MWAEGEPNWSYTVATGDASKLNTTAKTFTVDATHVWSYAESTVAAGEPGVTVGTSDSKGCIKMGSSKSVYFSPVKLTTDAFSEKAITKVNIYLKHNGKKAGSLTVKQGSTTIGTATTSETSDWINVTCSETNKGGGGTLTIQYEVAQALYINKIEVWYEDLGTATTTTIDASGITNTDIYLGTAAGSLSASVTKTVGGAAVGGATVSWSSSDEDVATIASDGSVTLKRKGSTTITASYAGDATYAASLAEYVLNVTNSAPQETDIIVATNYEWLGVEKTKSISASKEIDCEGVTVTVDKGDGTATRGDDTYIRLYAKNSLKFEAPANYVVTEIIFTKANSKWDNSFNVDAGSWDNTELKWTGAAREVTLTEDGTSGNNQISQIEIKLAASKDVTITAATWASFSSASALDFTNTDVTAYIAKEKDANNVTLTEIKKVPANTGIVVNAAAAGTYAIPVLSDAADATTDNLLKPWLTEGEPGDATYYTLAVDGGNPIFKKSSGGTLAAGKAYLVMPAAAAPELGVDFGGTTGINAVNGSEFKVNGEYYNLAGQRVANPSKGLYIVNGKKVIVK